MQPVSSTSGSTPIAAPAPRLHPLVAGAAVAVIAVSVLAGVALVNSQVSARHTVESQVVTAASGLAGDAPAPAAAGTQPALPGPVAKSAAARAPSAAARSGERRSPAPVAEVAAAPSAAPRTPIAAAPAAVPAPCADCGVVTAVREVKTAGQGTGVGAVAGGVLGGVLGNQIGKGSGRDAARIVGAIGGAVAGHQVEKQARATVRYEIDVRMDDGSLRTLSREAAPALRAGDPVRVDGQRIEHADGRPVAQRSAAPAANDHGGA